MNDEEKALRCWNAHQGDRCKVYSRYIYEDCKDCPFSIYQRPEFLEKRAAEAEQAVSA